MTPMIRAIMTTAVKPRRPGTTAVAGLVPGGRLALRPNREEPQLPRLERLQYPSRARQADRLR